MRFVTLSALTLNLFLFGSLAFGLGNDRFEGLDESFCPNIRISDYGYKATCDVADSRDVVLAEVGAQLTADEVKSLGFSLNGAVDIGLVPDPDSSTAYFYKRWLLDEKGQRVGVLTIEGWYNTEMETSARFDIRYNMKGEAVFLEEKSI